MTGEMSETHPVDERFPPDPPGDPYVPRDGDPYPNVWEFACNFSQKENFPLILKADVEKVRGNNPGPDEGFVGTAAVTDPEGSSPLIISSGVVSKIAGIRGKGWRDGKTGGCKITGSLSPGASSSRSDKSSSSSSSRNDNMAVAESLAAPLITYNSVYSFSW